MRIALAASPLPGMRSADVAGAVQRAWRAKRPGDTFDVRLVSDAVAEPYAGSGLADMLGLTRHTQLGGADSRRFAWSADSRILLDYTDGLPEDSASAGADIAWALATEAAEVILALPVVAPIGDLGCRMIRHLAGEPDTAPGSSVSAGTLGAARKALSSVHITALTGGEQRLVGLDGLARTWMRLGMGAAEAQAAEKRLGGLAASLTRAVEQLPRSELLPAPLAHGPYDGAGGGLAFGLRALGGRVLPVRQAVAGALESWASGADLCVYVAGTVGHALPDGLHAAVEQARREGVPLVLVYDSGGLRRGELATLGLNGAYEIRPERAFDDRRETPDSASALAAALAERAGRLATTWGWH